jgi:putative transposase
MDTGVLDRVWTSDITYLRTAGQGWLYLCTVRDGCSRVIGRAIDEHMRADLVESALAMAAATRGELAETVIVRADRGSTPARSWRGSPAGTV